MSLRTRLLLGSTLLVLVPLAVLGWNVREQMQRRLTGQYTERAATLMTIIREDLAAAGVEIDARLSALADQMERDNNLRLALVGGHDDLRPYVLDFAGRNMTLMGLDMLQLQDESGRILSSGHYRNEYDRREAELAALLAGTPTGVAVVEARQPEGNFLALARAHWSQLGGQRFVVIGGQRLDARRLMSLTRDRDLAVSLVFDGGAISSAPEVAAILAPVLAHRDSLATPPGFEAVRALRHQRFLVRSEPIPLIRDGRRYEAALIVSHPLQPLTVLLRRVNMWLATALLVIAAGSLVLAIWISGRISGPLRKLADRTAQLDLDRLEGDFDTGGRDEVGTLGRMLQELTDRLRGSASRLRAAERRATLGEVARQVNHDIRNGLTPLRNVLRHLSQLAETRPEELASTYRERRGTLESSLDYLEQLAGHYRRLAPTSRPRSCDLAAVLRAVAAAHAAPGRGRGNAEDGGGGITLELPDSVPPVLADPIALRRIIDNLVRNGLESLPPEGGAITLNLREERSPEPVIVLEVRDEGSGIAAVELERIFDDFYTTKAEGTGLGLSNVRRLVADCGATISVASAVGRGSVFTVRFPAQDEADPEPEDHTGDS